MYQLMTKQEVCELLRCSSRTLDRWRSMWRAQVRMGCLARFSFSFCTLRYSFSLTNGPFLALLLISSPTKHAATICTKFGWSWNRNFAMPMEPGLPTIFDCDLRPPNLGGNSSRLTKKTRPTKEALGGKRKAIEEQASRTLVHTNKAVVKRLQFPKGTTRCHHGICTEGPPTLRPSPPPDIATDLVISRIPFL